MSCVGATKLSYYVHAVMEILESKGKLMIMSHHRNDGFFQRQHV